MMEVFVDSAGSEEAPLPTSTKDGKELLSFHIREQFTY